MAAELLFTHVVGIPERRVRIADGRGVLEGHVCALGLVDNDLALQRLLDVYQGLQRIVGNLHRLGPVLGQVPALGQHHRHRIADVVHLAVGQRVLQKFHQVAVGPQPHRDLPRLDRGRNVIESEYGDDTQHLQRRLGIDRQDSRMGVGAAHDGGVQRVGQLHVINELPAARQEPPVLFSPDGSADVTGSHDITFELRDKFG